MEKKLCSLSFFVLAVCLGMAISLPWIFFMNRTSTLSSPSGSSHSYMDSPCGDWIPYKNVKCIKLVVQAGLQTKEEADVTCKGFTEELNGAGIPKLVTIKTLEKQRFLQKLLFEHHDTPDNVWLGLESGNDKLSWNDETDLLFNNWANNSTTVNDRRCVQMESGEGTYERGKWVLVNCKKGNAVVCERIQPWNVAALQNMLLSLRLEITKSKQESDEELSKARNEYEQKLIEAMMESQQKLIDAQKQSDQVLNNAKKEYYQKLGGVKNAVEKKLNESNQKISETYQKIAEAHQEIMSLKQNPVPIGFIYVQLPVQDPPTILWPQVSWKSVGPHYAGLFLRVEGGNAAPFGELQEDNTRRLAEVHNAWTAEDGNGSVSSDGSWSRYIWTGTNAGGKKLGLNVRLTTGEVRPRNKAVRIWQRIK